MGINLIRGAIGSGKTGICIDMIARVHAKHPDHKCIMLVPNHYSYATEKRFVKVFGGTGLNNIEVVTMRKLAVTLLDKASLNYITAAGRQMLILRAIEDYLKVCDIKSGSLLLTIKRQGFVEVMSSLISEFKRYMVTPDDLLKSAEKVNDDGIFKSKLTAIAEIYRRYNEYIDLSAYSDMEDDNIRVADAILKNDAFNENTHIWVDRFDEFTPQQMRVLDALAGKGTDMTITVCCPLENVPVYSQMQSTLIRLDDLLVTHGLGEVIDSGTEFKRKKSDEIKLLLKNWGADKTVYDRETEDISLFLAGGIYSEVERTAGRIVDLAREEGYRYRDIAILCGKTEEYSHIIETVFSEYNIPYFADSKIILSDHPIAMQILSVFDIFESDWSYESVFRYLKAGFIYSRREGGAPLLPLDSADIDYLENYVLKYAIAGSRRWQSEEAWTDGEGVVDAAFNTEKDTVINSRADNIRREAAAPLIKLYSLTRGRKRASDFAKSVFEFLCDINLNSGLKSEIRRMRDEGLINEAEQFTKLWNLLLDVLNQTTVALGDTKMTFDEFGRYMRAGLAKCEIRTIPSGIDQVYVGNVEKCASSDVRAMFIVGANDGTFPSEIESEGFLSNNDRNTLAKDYGIQIAPNTKKKTEKQYFKVYRALCDVSEKLFLSRPIANGDGKPLTPSVMVNDIERVMPYLKTVSELDEGNDIMYVSTPEATIHKMLINKSAVRKTAPSPVWEAVYEWYAKKGEWRNFVSLIGRAEWFMKSDAQLDEDLAKQLYETKTVYSASRINNFSQCPFGYFMQYGIRAREREEWEIDAAEVGTYAHEVIREFCETVEKDAADDNERLKSWKELTDNAREELLDGIIDTTCENMLSNNPRDAKKNAAILSRTGRNIKNAAKTIHRALSAGKYTQHGMEREFEIQIGDNISLRGIIDRVDMYKTDEETRVRIVDYKTGRTKFDIVNIANGVDMQMALYALAALDMAREEYNQAARITGIYYNKVHNNLLSIGLDGEDNEADKKRESEIRLDGVTFVRTDADIADEDEAVSKGMDSSFLNISYKKDGSRKKSNSVHSDAEAAGLLSFVSDKVLAIDAEIKSGNIKASPYKQGSSVSCDYCAYSEVCTFTQNREPRIKSGTENDIWKEMARNGGEE